MTGNETFKPFKVSIPIERRYWEDESTGVVIKQGQLVEIGPRQFRSSELRFALLRNQVLIKDGVAEFAFKDKLVRVTPGKNKNIIIDVEENKNETEKNVEENKNEDKSDNKKDEIVIQTKKEIVKEDNTKKEKIDVMFDEYNINNSEEIIDEKSNSKIKQTFKKT